MSKPFGILVLRSAEVDVIEAASWYDSQSPGLGDRFIDSFEETLTRIVTWWPSEVKYGLVRIRQMESFPFGVHFRVNEKERCITIEAVLHEKRKPREEI